MNLFDRFLVKQGTASLLLACEKCVSKHFYTDAERLEPVNLVQFAESLGLKVSYAHKMSAEGMIRQGVSGQAEIVLSAGSSRRRERFTLAHEIAHWLISRELGEVAPISTRAKFRGVSSVAPEVKQEERLADLLAAELLLPQVVVRDRLGNEGRLVDQVQDLCREFVVSRVAALRRFADVGGDSIFVVNLIPRRIANFAARPEVDDAMFALSQKSTVYSRERTRLLSHVSFADLAFSQNMRLCFDTMFNQIEYDFELDFVQNPIPHVYALTRLPKDWQAA